jgi:hypothetical protein
MRNPIPETPWVISLRIQREKKGDYTQAARKRGMKLLPWIIETLDREADTPASQPTATVPRHLASRQSHPLLRES